MKVTFDDYMKRVDKCLGHLCGLESSDLPDACYADYYESGVKPMACAEQVLDDLGYDSELEAIENNY